MIQKILVAYVTNSGTTGDVARAVAEELQKSGAQVDVLTTMEVSALESYDAVVLGAPMIMGWHREAARFLKKNQKALGRVPLALFITCMNFTRTEDAQVDGVPIFVDEKLPKIPAKPGKLSLREKYSTPKNYLHPILKSAPAACPVSVAFFGGCLQYFTLKFFPMMFVMLIIRAMPGDKRNWDAIRTWSGSLFLQGEKL